MRKLFLSFLILVVILFPSCLSAQTTLYFGDNFEDGLGKWSYSGLGWDTTSSVKYSGKYCLTDSKSGNYPSNANIAISTVNQIDLTTAKNPYISFWDSYNIYYDAAVKLEISKDNGVSWTTLNTIGVSAQKNWNYKEYSLQSYIGSKIKIRFRLTSETYTSDGYYIDDIKLQDNATDTSNGLVAYFPFNGNANDESGQEHKGIIYGASLVADRFGDTNQAYHFNGVNQYMDLGSWFGYQTFSISLWIYPGEMQGTYASIIDNNHSAGKNWNIQQENTATNSYYFGVKNSARHFSLSTNTWQHVVVIKNHDSISVYKNGNCVANPIYSGGVDYFNPLKLVIGSCYNSGNLMRFWNGRLDDIKIYNRALTNSEIIGLYNENPSNRSGIFCISPNSATTYESTIDINISAYPISDNAIIELVNESDTIKADSIMEFNKFNLKARFLCKNKNAGIYDILLISSDRSNIFRLKKAFTLIHLVELQEPLDTDNDGYRNVTTFANLAWIFENSSANNLNYKLENDIDASESEQWYNGKGFKPFANFTGIIDGHGHSIKHLTFNRPTQDSVAFISQLSRGAIIRNLALANCNIKGQNYAAGFIASNNGTISNCSFTGTISGNNNVGSITGNNNGTIKFCYNSALISGNDYVGGLVGNSTNFSIISKCFNQGKVIGKDINIAGIVGSNRGKISDCYNIGSIIGSGEVAGIAGWNYGNISNVYNVGLINGAGNAVGAIIGINSGSSLINSFSNKETSGGIKSQYGVNGTEKTTSEMKNQSTYTNWDFTYTWEIMPTMNNGYPQLTWSSNPNMIRSYSPDRVANLDDCTITFEGSGFDSNTKVFLSKIGQDTIKTDTLIYSVTNCIAHFNLKNAVVGSWNIMVQYPDTMITFINGLSVEEKKGGELKIEILGSSVARVGRNASFTIKVTNTSNFTYENPCIEIAVSSLDPSFKVYSDIYNSIDKEIFDKLGFDVREFYFTKTEDKLGQNRNCKLGMFFLSNLSAYESKEILISVRSSENYTISAWHSDYTVDQFAEDAVNIVYTGGNTHKNTKLSKYKSETINVCDKIYADCYNNFMSEVNKTIGEAAEGQLLDLIPIEEAQRLAKRSYDMIKLYQKMNNAAERGDIEAYDGAIIDFITNKVVDDYKGTFLTYTKNVLTSIVASKEVVKAISDGTIDNLISTGKALTRSEAKNLIRKASLKSLSKLTALAEFVGYLLSDGAVWGLNALKAKEICKPSLNDCSIPDNSPRYNVSTVSSFDPNDKIGYRSPSGSTYFNENNTNFTYIINFENKETATAAAQEVTIDDTLDLKCFNIESFRADYVKIGDKKYSAPLNIQENKWAIDMRPEKNLITYVTLTLNKESGVAKWYFRCVDPATMEFPEDAKEGFLPPNDSLGNGEGSVMFTINLKDSTKNNVTIKNKAQIVFDDNAPIFTPTWTNTKDMIAPKSYMNQPKIVSDSIATLSWGGEDNKYGSGIYTYNVYVKKSDEKYRTLLSNTQKDSIDFIFGTGVGYSFYVIATDSAGNAEVKTNVPDVTLLTTSVGKIDLPTYFDLSQNYPNPFNPVTTINYQLPITAMVTLKIYNILGQEVVTLVNEEKKAGYYKKEFNASNFGSGVYIYRIKVGTYVNTKKMLFIK